MAGEEDFFFTPEHTRAGAAALPDARLASCQEWGMTSTARCRSYGWKQSRNFWKKYDAPGRHSPAGANRSWRLVSTYPYAVRPSLKGSQETRLVTDTGR
jgi:hypothetical protein